MPRVQNLVHAPGGHAPGPGVQRRVQRNGMTALGTRPLLSLAPYGTDLRCTHHAHGRPSLQRFVFVTPKAVGGPSTIGCPWTRQCRVLKHRNRRYFVPMTLLNKRCTRRCPTPVKDTLTSAWRRRGASHRRTCTSPSHLHLFQPERLCSLSWYSSPSST